MADALQRALALAPRVPKGPVPPLDWYAAVAEANGAEFRSENPTFFRLAFDLFAPQTWEDAAVAVNAVLLAQLTPLVRSGLDRSDARTRPVVAALLPALWSLHTAGPHPEHDLWPVLDRMRYARNESSAEAVLRQLVTGKAHLPRKVARLRAYAHAALTIRPAQLGLFGGRPPDAEALYARVVREDGGGE